MPIATDSSQRRLATLESGDGFRAHLIQTLKFYVRVLNHMEIRFYLTTGPVHVDHNSVVRVR
ncbi:MAG: hypothetical protein WCH39_11860 [Schlesneria sp.]